MIVSQTGKESSLVGGVSTQNQSNDLEKVEDRVFQYQWTGDVTSDLEQDVNDLHTETRSVVTGVEILLPVLISSSNQRVWKPPKYDS